MIRLRPARFRAARLARSIVLPALGGVLAASAAAEEAPAPGEVPPAEARDARAAPAELATAEIRDVEAKDRLFDRGIPYTEEAFSPDGFHFAYLHLVPGGFLSRRPARCAFLLDLGTGGTRAIPTPRGRAARIGGWDPTGRYLLLEAHQPDFLSSLTGSWTTYHYVFDVVTSEYVARKPFTGRRDERRFRWKQRRTYHGEWAEGRAAATVWPLYDGELAEIHQRRQQHLVDEDERRRVTAAALAVGPGRTPQRTLGDVLSRLDEHWSQRGQRDPVVSELFGERPSLFVRDGDSWIEIHRETEYVAVLDRELVILTGRDGAQSVFHRGRWEMLPLPRAPEGWDELLQTRWDRAGQFYDETDPLPRDLQCRRSYDATRGVAQYFNVATPDMGHLLMLYSFSSDRRVVRIVDLPESWGRSGD